MFDLFSVEPAGLSDRALHDHLRAVERVRAQVDAAALRALAELERRGPAALGRSLDAGAWLADQCRVSAGEAKRRADVAERLDSLPVTAAALASGEISFGHASAIAKAADRKHAEAVRLAEAKLVDQAKRLGADDFGREVRRFCDQVDADGGLSRAKRQHESRTASLFTNDRGMGCVRADLDPVGFATIKSTANAIADQMWRADHPDHDGPIPILERTNRQRLADALVEMARRAHATTPAVAREAKPAVMVVIEHDTLVDKLRRDYAELVGVGDICAETARRLACDCDLIPIVLGTDGEALDVGRAQRLATRAMRRALVARDGGCRFPGCTRPVDWCDAHHIVWWERNGVTAVHNLALLCERHHHYVHEGGWSLTGTGAHLTFTSPDGERHESRLRPPSPPDRPERHAAPPPVSRPHTRPAAVASARAPRRRAAEAAGI